MKRFKKTKKILILVSILAIGSVSFYILFFNSIKNKNEKISILRNEITTINKKNVSLKSVKKLIKDTENSREQLDTYLIDEDGIVDFIEMIERVGVDIGVDTSVSEVNLLKNELDQTGEDEKTELLHLKFNIEGVWGRVFHFFALVERLPLKIDILKASLDNIRDEHVEEGEEKGARLWRGDFSITVVKIK